MANLTNSAKLIEEMSKKANASSLAAVATSGNSDDVTEWSNHKFVTAQEKTAIWNLSWINTWDETTATIKNKLGITTLSWSNTWDETAATIKTKLWIETLSWSNTWDETATTIKNKLGKASTTQDWYLSKEDYATFFSSISWVYRYKWSVTNYSDLSNITDPDVWDVYNVTSTEMNYAWDWTAWDALWWTVDLSNYAQIDEVITKTNTTSFTPTGDYHPATKKYVDDWLSWKQATLNTQTAYTSKGSSTKVPQITTNSLWQVTEITEITIDQPDISGKANISDVLTKTNTTSYTPSANYHPATKKYVDDKTVYCTQAEYDALPSSKTSDWNTYIIYATS